MSELTFLDVTHRFYDERGRQVDESYHPEFAELKIESAEVLEAYEWLIDELGVDKSPEFVRIEEEARAFIKSIALETSAKVHLLKEGEAMDLIELREPDTTVAQTDSFLGDIFVRAEVVDEWTSKYGEDPIGGLLVHELAHTAKPLVDTVHVQVRHGDQVAFSCRSGLGMVSPKGEHGVFYEEAFATYAAGWYRRCKTDRLAPTIDMSQAPCPELPIHYRLAKGIDIDNEEPMISGLDGYAIELLARGVQERNIMPAADFIATMFEARRPETATQSFRNFAQAVDRLESGLYRYLRDLEYSKDDWEEGCARVYEVVTGKEWKAA